MSAREPTLRDLIAPIVEDIVAKAKPAAVMISQRNCETTLGIPPRTHLENCRRPDFTPHVVAHGKLRLVDAGEYQAWLHELGRRDHHHENVDSEDGAAGVLRELGLHEVKASAKKSNRSHATRDLARTRVG